MANEMLILVFAFFFWIIQGKIGEANIQGPVFLQEIPLRLEFVNTRGGLVDCLSHGVPPPIITWTLTDGSPVLPVTDIRLLPPNGSLVFPPFPAERFRHDVHTAIYRCFARNQVGIIRSRDVIVRAVVNQKFDVQVYDEYVISGNTAVLRCQVPNYVSDFVIVTSWVQDEVVNIYPGTVNGGKYAILKTGELIVFNVGPSDGSKTYSCRILNKLTGDVQSSSYAAKIYITEVTEKTLPRAIVDKHVTKNVRLGEDVLLPCIAQGYPIPSYRWYKEEHDQLIPINKGERVEEIAPGFLHFFKVKLEDGGKYVCLANNTAGEETIQIILIITAPLSAHIQPHSQVIDVGRDTLFTCNHGGSPIIQIQWYHNGRKLSENHRTQFLTSPDRLLIKNIQKEDQGMYQCFVSNDWDSAQSMAELQLGDAMPEFISKFSEQTLQPGPSVSLKCSATGNPPPQFIWTLDGFPIPDSSRFMVGQYITLSEDVISHVNISHIKDEDGGEYMCTARNQVGQISHSAKINVFGLPFIRPMPKTIAVAGSTLIMKCPVAGYPIDLITWEKDGSILPINRRQRVFSNGTLIVDQVQKGVDAGTYTCQARNKQSYSVRRDVDVQVIVPPKILPIQSMRNLLQEGMRAAITCSIVDGDLPITFRFEKDGQAINLGSDFGISVRRMDEYTSALVIENISPQHSGNYTCWAQNQAGSESFTVPVTVNVPPRWSTEPADLKVASGNDVVISCQAAGYPEPTITWKKSIGKFQGEFKDFSFMPNVHLFSNGSLKFEKVTRENEGQYLCEAKNDIGTGISKLIEIKVNVPAHFPQKLKQIQVIKGQPTHLQCSALGDAPIDIIWKIKGKVVQDGQDPRYFVREHVVEDGIMSELGISIAYREDTGVVSCFTKNTYGHDEMKITLIVQEVPETPKNVRVKEQQSRSIQIAWTQPYAGNSPITYYIVQYKLVLDDWEHDPQKVIVPSTNTMATIPDLKPDSTYNIRVIAENGLGTSEPSEIVQVTTQEEIPSGAPTNIEAVAKSSTEIRVRWKPPQRELWNGKILGYNIGYQEHTSGYSPSNQPAAVTPSNYNFKTVEIGSQYTGEILLNRLNKFTTYSVVLQAFNSKGAGPTSEPIVVRTKEDVPSAPPKNIRCKTVNSESLEVQWEPPNSEGLHGILLGFKVTYQLIDSKYDFEGPQTKLIFPLRTIISNLMKYSNYSITVLAYTAVGDGVKSAPIYCMTDEDAPSAPSDIKGAMSAVNKILVSWLPPAHKNGELIGYTIYLSTIEDGKEEGTHKKFLPPDAEYHETVRLQDKATYQFWITASTRLGEGESSRIVTIPPTNKVPARIMSFSREIVTPWKQNWNLTCRKVGIPTPSTMWKFFDKPLEKSLKRQVLKDGSLIIKDIQHADQGNYTCLIENIYGRDEITYKIIVEVPPDRPTLIIISATSDSLQLQWNVTETNRHAILGYVINYKRDHGDWEELQIDSSVNTYTLENLWCATRYQLYITAYNHIGTGLPCDIVNAYTKGSTPIKPNGNYFLTANTTSASIWLDTWQDGGCPILYFIVEYRAHDTSSWSSPSNNVQPSDKVYTLTGLRPGFKYFLRITAHNNAGSTLAIYNFTTLPLPGVSVTPTEDSTEIVLDDVPFLNNIYIVTIIVAAISIIIVIVSIIFIQRKKLFPQPSSNEALSHMQNEQNRDQYLAIQSREVISKMNKTEEGYVEEICPYATFQISKPSYNETTYSGNIYSGPYSSVKGSFVYHDSKQGNNESLKLKQFKEPEYCKVRHKGGRLRDPHSESQESDNLGSTDSEVKKILSMHLPISEYDTLGSDSEGEELVRAGTSSQELLAMRHTRSRERKKSGEDDSSSSTEMSPSSGGRKSFHARKSKSKRNVRSSSGYSSHTEEINLSEINIHNAETVECHKLHGKRRANKGNIGSRYMREATSFQIDV